MQLARASKSQRCWPIRMTNCKTAAWVLFALLALAEFGNYRHSKNLTRLCELTSRLTDYSSSDARRREVDSICSERLSD